MGGFKRQAVAAQDRRQAPARLGAIAERGLDLFCWCNRCGHNAVLPTGPLVERLGPDMPVPEIGARLVCRDCGARDVATRPAWPSAGPITRHG